MERWLERAINCPSLILFHKPNGMFVIELIGFNGVCTKSIKTITEADCKKCEYVTSENGSEWQLIYWSVNTKKGETNCQNHLID